MAISVETFFVEVDFRKGFCIDALYAPDHKNNARHAGLYIK